MLSEISSVFLDVDRRVVTATSKYFWVQKNSSAWWANVMCGATT